MKDITDFLEKVITWPRDCGEYHTHWVLGGGVAARLSINVILTRFGTSPTSFRTRNWGLRHSVPYALLGLSATWASFTLGEYWDGQTQRLD